MFVRLDLSVRNQVTVTRFDLISEAVIQADAPHAQALGVVADALSQWGIEPNQVQGFAVVVGAGSFTATRVATTIANAWAYVYGTPVIGLMPGDDCQTANLIERFAGAAHFLSATYSGAPAIGRA